MTEQTRTTTETECLAIVFNRNDQGAADGVNQAYAQLATYGIIGGDIRDGEAAAKEISTLWPEVQGEGPRLLVIFNNPTLAEQFEKGFGSTFRQEGSGWPAYVKLFKHPTAGRP